MKRSAGEVDVAVLGQVADGHLGHLEPQAGAGRDGVAVGGEEPDERRADVAAAEQPDPDHATAVGDRLGRLCHMSSCVTGPSGVTYLQTQQVVERLPADDQAGLAVPATKTTAGRGTLL